VWDRDGGACVQCGERFELQFDHVIPLALGGANTAENLQVLCGDCNRAKGATVG
jgi:5-methylcytosine-specific restriction endonuclease McrA